MKGDSGRLAMAVLAFCCVCWGFSFPVMQISAAAVDRAIARQSDAAALMREKLATRATFNGWRFVAAGMICWAFAARRRRPRVRAEAVGGAVVGLCFGGGMLFQLIGLQYTLPSTSSFLTALAVVFAPIAQSLLLRRIVGMRVWLAAALALSGMAVLSSGNPRAAAAGTLAVTPPLPYLGEGLTVLASVLFTAQILSLDHYGQHADGAAMTVATLLAAGGINLAIGLLLGGSDIYHAAVVSRLARDFTFLWSFWGLVLFSSVLAIQLMNTWQPRIAPATAAVVYCLEPVFGTLFSIAFGAERLTIVTLSGGAIILAAVLVVARRSQGQFPLPRPVE